jgi:hypothetical protein
MLIAAKIAVHHDDTAAEVARGIDAAEAKVREQFPHARLIYLEPALDQAYRKQPSTAVAESSADSTEETETPASS